MQINKLTAAAGVNFKGSAGETKNAADAENKENGKTKLYLALAGLAVLGTAAALFYKGRGAEAAGAAKKASDSSVKAAEEVKNAAEGVLNPKRLPFNDSIVSIDLPSGEFAAHKQTILKYSGVYNGRDVIVERKLIDGPMLPDTNTYDFIRDAQNGKLIIKPVTLEGKTRRILPDEGNSAVRGILRKTEAPVVNGGIERAETYKNGELYAVRTTEILDDFSKKITVDYGGKDGFGSSSAHKKIITIPVSGKKDVTEENKPEFI